MRNRLLLPCVLAVSVWAQSDDPKEILVRVRDNLMQTIARMPRYMCTQTIDRATYHPDLAEQRLSCDDLLSEKNRASLKLATTDRLRLDVAIAASNEIYSWVGEDRFDDRDLFQLVRQGALQNGSFSTFLVSIFEGSSANFTYNGDTTVNGRTLAEFGYEVPKEKSTYVFGNRKAHVTSGYGGTFLVDPQSFDLVRLVVRSDQLPSEVDACQATTSLDYHRVRLNDSSFLLPSQVQLDIVNRSGSESRNRTLYSGCHEFLGKSTLSFGDARLGPDAGTPGALGSSPNSAARTLAVPFGLSFKVEFTQAIDAATAAAGDKISGKIRSAIRDSTSNQILVPEGSPVTARIVRLEHVAGPPQSLTIAVKLETVTVGGRSRPLRASMGSGVKRFRQQTGLTQRSELGSLAPSEGPGVGVLEFRNVSENYVVKSGLESQWTTLAPE